MTDRTDISALSRNDRRILRGVDAVSTATAVQALDRLLVWNDQLGWVHASPGIVERIERIWDHVQRLAYKPDMAANDWAVACQHFGFMAR